MGNDKKSWQQPNEDHDGGNDEKQKEAGQKARKDMNLQIFQTRTSLSLRALGLLLAGSASTVQWGGGRLFDASANFFFYENSHNSETKRRKIDPEVGNEPSLRGLQTDHWTKLGSYGKNRIFGPKTEILGPKKVGFITLTMLWPRPGSSSLAKK